MIDKESQIKILLDQRYYSFVLMKEFKKYNVEKYWAKISTIYDIKNKYNILFTENCKIHIAQIFSSDQFVRGALLNNISLKKDGKPPYCYDLIVVEVVEKSDTYYAFLFPMLFLARTLIEYLLKDDSILKCMDFQKAQLGMMLDEAELLIDNNVYPMVSRIINMRMNVASETTISVVNIKGDAPIKSIFYNDVIKKNISLKNFLIEYCGFLCELDLQLSEGMYKINSKLRARIGADDFGNFKIYLQSNGVNIYIVSYFVKMLISRKLLKSVFVNPLNRIREEDENEY